jgi:hypothetical protein
MIDTEGHALTDSDLLDKVMDMGALVVFRGTVEKVDYTKWRARLRADAKSRGFRIHTHRTGDGAVIVSNPDHVVDPQRLRTAAYGASLNPDHRAD